MANLQLGCSTVNLNCIFCFVFLPSLSSYLEFKLTRKMLITRDFVVPTMIFVPPPPRVEYEVPESPKKFTKIHHNYRSNIALKVAIAHTVCSQDIMFVPPPRLPIHYLSIHSLPTHYPLIQRYQ